jgi:hypothetical protein
MLMAALATGVPPAGPPTLGQWAAQDSAARRLSMVGAMEGALLAASAPNGASLPINSDCFSTETPQSLEDGLLSEARLHPGLPLVQGLIRLRQCAPRGGAR